MYASASSVLAVARVVSIGVVAGGGAGGDQPWKAWRSGGRSGRSGRIGAGLCGGGCGALPAKRARPAQSPVEQPLHSDQPGSLPGAPGLTAAVRARGARKPAARASSSRRRTGSSPSFPLELTAHIRANRRAARSLGPDRRVARPGASSGGVRPKTWGGIASAGSKTAQQGDVGQRLDAPFKPGDLRGGIAAPLPSSARVRPAAEPGGADHWRLDAGLDGARLRCGAIPGASFGLISFSAQVPLSDGNCVSR